MTVQSAAAAGQQVRECAPPSQPYENARLFVEERYTHPERARLVFHGGEWFSWSGTCWPVRDHSYLRAQIYRYFERCVYLVPGKKEGVLEPVPFNPTRRKIDDILDALKSLVHIPQTENPAWLWHAVDRGPALPNAPAAEIVACTNGLVHVPTRTLHGHTPRFYVHSAVPFDYLPDAQKPQRWLGFLRDLWGGDFETIRTLQEIFGYVLSGDTRQQKLFLLIGPKRSGKGTIARVLTALIGREYIAAPTLAGLATNFGLSPMIGKPLAIIADARLASGHTSIVTERLLSISGEDQLTIDRKYREPWTGQLPTRIVVLSNELPRLTDSSGALASRFVMLIMTHSFYGRENPDLTRELCAELPAIFNWSLDGLERLHQRGRFQQPAASEDAIRELEDLSSPMGAFVRDQCLTGPAHEVPCDELYQRWRSWCEEQGRDRPGTVQTFGRDLRAVLPGLKVVQPRTDRDRERRYCGIKPR